MLSYLSMILAGIGVVLLFWAWSYPATSKIFLKLCLLSNIAWIVSGVISFQLIGLSIPLIAVNAYMFYRGIIQLKGK